MTGEVSTVLVGSIEEIIQDLNSNGVYKLQYREDGEWKTWVPAPAPWEKKPFGEEIPLMVVIEGIISNAHFPLRIIKVKQ